MLSARKVFSLITGVVSSQLIYLITNLLITQQLIIDLLITQELITNLLITKKLITYLLITKQLITNLLITQQLITDLMITQLYQTALRNAQKALGNAPEEDIRQPHTSLLLVY